MDNAIRSLDKTLSSGQVLTKCTALSYIEHWIVINAVNSIIPVLLAVRNLVGD